MIRGLHGMFHSSDANASRAFIRDKLRLPFTDVGGLPGGIEVQLYEPKYQKRRAATAAKRVARPKAAAKKKKVVKKPAKKKSAAPKTKGARKRR